MKKLIFSFTFMWVFVLCPANVPAASAPELSDLKNLNVKLTDFGYVISNMPQYVPDEIIVKFKKPVPDKSNLTHRLNKKYKIKNIKSLFKNFKANQKHLESLLKKNKALLTKKEKHLLKRLKRAPKNAKVPELDKIFKLKLDLKKGQSLEQALQDYRPPRPVTLCVQG